MTATLEDLTRAARSEAATVADRRGRLRRWWHEHRVGAAYVVPLLALTAAGRIVNLGGAPQRIDDEGTYTAQAWAVETLGKLGHYTYWYDHPPLGWIQIAGWTFLTRAFARHDVSVLAGREAMVLASVASAALLWLLARRLGVRRPFAAAALVLFAVSPLAVQFGRTVYLDNVAVPWLLAAFVLALSQRRQLAAFAGSAVCLAVAVLSKETFLLMLPFLAWQLWRSSHPQTRRYTLSVSGAMFVLTTSCYGLYALVKGELLPGADHVSLWRGITFQLVNRAASGSVLDAKSQAGSSVRTWLDLDAVLLLAGVLAAVVALSMRRFRPYAVAVLVMTATVFKPGYLPVPFVIVLLPLMALLIAGVLDQAVRRGRLTAIVAGLAALAMATGAGFLWPHHLRLLWGSDVDLPLRQAEAWAVANVPSDDQILVDDAVWLDLVRDGMPQQDVVWYYKADTDPNVYDLYPGGWQDYEYVLVTEGMRQSAGTSGLLDTALANGLTVASFGDGPPSVQIVRVLPSGLNAFYAAAYSDRQARLPAGRALLHNGHIAFSAAAQADVDAGRVDSRLLVLLARFSAGYRLDVADFPVVDGEQGSGLPARTVVLTGVDGSTDGAAADRFVAAVTAQEGALAGAQVDRTNDAITIRFPVAAPQLLLPAPPER